MSDDDSSLFADLGSVVTKMVDDGESEKPVKVVPSRRKPQRPVKRATGPVSVATKTVPGTNKVAKVLAKRPHRWRAGTVAKREIRQLQRTTNHLIPKANFRRLVKEIMGDRSDIVQKIERGAMEALQEAAETRLQEMFYACQTTAEHNHRETIIPQDIKFTEYLRKVFQTC